MAVAEERRGDLLRRGALLAREGKITEAIGVYGVALQQDPSDWATANVVGDLYLRLGDISAAVTHLNSAAELLAAEGFSAKASAVYKKVLRVRPDDEDVLLRAAAQADARGLRGEAEALTLQAASGRRARGDHDGARALESGLVEGGTSAAQAPELPAMVVSPAPNPLALVATTATLESEAAGIVDLDAALAAASEQANVRHQHAPQALQLIRFADVEAEQPESSPVSRSSDEPGQWRVDLMERLAGSSGLPEMIALIVEVEQHLAQAAEGAHHIAIELDDTTGDVVAHTDLEGQVETEQLRPEDSVLAEARAIVTELATREAADAFARGREYEREGQMHLAIGAMAEASSCVAFRFSAASVVGRHYLDTGAALDGLKWLERASEVPAEDADSNVALAYDVGRALEELGEGARALAVMVDVQRAAGVSYRDVESRVDRLSGLA